MSKLIKGMPKNISEVLVALAEEHDNKELEKVATYVEDLEEQISYYKESSEMVFKYITAYSRMRVGLMILAGQTSLGKKVDTLELSRKFAREVIKYADDC